MATLKQIEQQIKINFRPGQKFSAQDLLALTHLSRSMISGYLNQLYKVGILAKANTRPTKFWLPLQEKVFADVIGAHDSLAPIIEQCRAAVNYPPDGLPVIIRGSSGVGKSMLAKKIYQYALAQRVIQPDAPFVTLNCADYANNPELLSSVLFGYVTGAFTGATKDRTGLLDAADTGYLFLDEVHNLSQENQEKLFLLIDKKKFHRLGEDNNWHQAKIRIILATTENTKTALLATFRRRIPLEVTLPDFQARSYHEKLELIWHFFENEAKQINRKILVSTTLLDDLFHSHDEGNVGAIQNKIKVSCAQAYSQQENSSVIHVPTSNLNNYITIDSKQMTLLNQSTITNILQQTFPNLTAEGIGDNLGKFLALLKPYCSSDNLGYQIILHNLEKGLNELKFFGLKFSFENLKELAILINLLFDYRSINVEIKPKISFKYFRIIQELNRLTHQDNFSPLMQLMLVSYLQTNLPITTKRPALVIMHGKNSATSIASEANQLIGDYVYTSIDMPVQVKTREIVKKVNEYVQQIETKEGLILLVDMGSLEKMYSEIKDNVQGDLLILNNISTALALEVGFALKQNQPMEYFTQLDYTQFNVESQYFEGIARTQNIVISCMSGQGVAEKIKEILDKFKPKNEVEVLTLDYNKLKKLKDLNNPTTFKNTFCIIATSQISIPGVECINLERVVNGNQNLTCLGNLYTSKELEQFTNELIKLFTIEGASSRLQFLNPDKVINEISDIITALEQQYHVVFKNFIRVNLYLHLSSMIERILLGDIGEDSIEIKDFKFQKFVQVAEAIFQSIKNKYNIKIPLQEYEYVYQIIEGQIES
ncbi:sigma 54-interacting transcriptional regulator [Xylocopilactobacillus apicola]|uniref:RNA polymerase subunit sigma-54 n=1 Tax=Xylocopilactobacillus apicola TaxID=2932184 RepID=A0AAU9CY64_9LACO|nr:sigma 54-interacting transcriptional regulator [Xylocopilactobacillus apicola]BDR58979.1 RNA polymerase subunit sigma-54 [Xylocopilactobacillus apicola]